MLRAIFFMRLKLQTAAACKMRVLCVICVKICTNAASTAREMQDYLWQYSYLTDI